MDYDYRLFENIIVSFMEDSFRDPDDLEIGYDISDLTYRQKGFMTEAVKAIISYGFTTLRLHRIEALVGSQNIPSLKIMEKNQFRKEGLLRQHYYSSGRYDDTIVFSKLDHEYHEEAKANS